MSDFVAIRTSIMNEIGSKIIEKSGSEGPLKASMMAAAIGKIGSKSSSTVSSPCVVFMRNGEVVKKYSLEEFKNVTTLPAIPTIENLTAQSWNWTLEQIKTYIENQNVQTDIIVGASYVTTDGKTHLYITIPKNGRLTVPLYIGMIGQIEWGDGETTACTTSTAQQYNHTYSKSGNYVIKLNVTSGNLTFGNGTYSYNIFGSTSNDASVPGRSNSGILTKINIGNSVTSIGSYAFYYCFSLQAITIPNSVTSIESYAFNQCFGVRTYDISQTTDATKIPTIANSSYVQVNDDTRIVVNKAIFDNWKIATNWSSYATKMYYIDEVDGVKYLFNKDADGNPVNSGMKWED